MDNLLANPRMPVWQIADILGTSTHDQLVGPGNEVTLSDLEKLCYLCDIKLRYVTFKPGKVSGIHRDAIGHTELHVDDRLSEFRKKWEIAHNLGHWFAKLHIDDENAFLYMH